MTGLDLVSASMRKIGALASGDTAAAQDSTDALAELNRMIATWSTEGLLVYSTARETFTLTSGVGTYSMGTGATLNTTRPTRIEESGLIIGSTEYPVRLITQEEYARISIKTLQGIPAFLYSEGTDPNETLNLYPVPNSGYTLVTYAMKQLASVASLSATLSFPPGYEDALLYNLSVRLAPEYGRPIDPIVAELAVNTKAAIKRLNSKPQYLRVDNALKSSGVNGAPTSIQAFNSGDF